jgi:Rrf2 family cysteine metabolism transcriptional repressor
MERVAAPLRVTERLDHALKSVLLLAQHQGTYVTTQFIADHYDMSAKTLATVLPSLCEAGLLKSRAGWHGGFALARPPSEITVASIVQATLGEPRVIDLVAERAPGATIDAFWRSLDAHVQDKLATVTAAHLLDGGF